MPNEETGKNVRRYTLSRSSRIQRSSDYKRIYNRGKRFRNRAALMYVARGRKRSIRIGFVATKRIGHAVNRNRAKRLMKEVYRLHRHEMVRGYDVIMLAGSFLTRVSFKDAEKAILALWSTAGLMEKK